MERIGLLSNNLINQIAAGEVIERPASVVKELVENSIDSGANRIEISISNNCRNIRVADNGSGIYPDDIPLAFTNHATSKLKDEEELFNINTLGFRGEALASIISIAKITCTTRTQDFDYGTKVEAMESKIKTAKIGCAVGTIMEVSDLFYNQPARLKFLKSSKTEFAYIQELVQSLAISNPKVAFVLKNDDNIVINTTPNSDLLTRITQIYSESIITEVKEVNKSDDITGINISGFISTPNYTRSSKKSIYTFVNSRIIKCPVLTKAIDVAYANMMPKGRYPFVVLNLKISPDEIDINVHPQKKEIRYKNPNQIFNFVRSAIDFALINVGHIQNENLVNITSISTIKPSVNNMDEPFVSDTWDKPPTFPLNIVKSNNEFKIEEKNYDKDNNAKGYEYNIEKNHQVKMGIDFETPQQIKKINVVGQLSNTYIMVENSDNLEIIDQHIAEERYIYEKLKQEKIIASQLIIVSNVIDVEPSDVVLLENASSQLERFGYRIDKVSDTQVIFKKIPQIVSNVNQNELLAELIKNLKNSQDNSLDTLEEKILITTSCKAAIKAGDKLTLWQMEEIVKNLRSTKNPYTCPHGRPISHFVPLKKIASFFERK